MKATPARKPKRNPVYVHKKYDWLRWHPSGPRCVH